MIQKIEVGDLVGETIDGETYFGMVILAMLQHQEDQRQEHKD